MAQYEKLINLSLLNQFLTKAKTIFAPKITASGILKGDGAGNVSAATAGTDYLSPSALTSYRTAVAQDAIDAGLVSAAATQSFTDSQQAQARANIGAASKLVLLWENASLNSDFAAQTLTINMSGYDLLLMVSLGNKSHTEYFVSLIPVIVGTFVSTSRITASSVQDYRYMLNVREITIESLTALKIGDNAYSRPGNYATNRQDLNIPYQIYGIKGVTN